MILGSLESSHWEESDDSKFIVIGLILTEKFNVKVRIGILYMWNSRNTKYFDFFLIITGSSDQISMILGSLESSHREESNGSKFITIGLILDEKFNFKVKIGILYM
jgi:hypothetical protein